MKIDKTIVGQHQQLDDYGCIPMSVELVLKLLGRVPADYYDLQKDWRNRRDGSFNDFNGRTIAGVRFRHQFGLARNEQFPLDDLFRTIDSELAADRYVIISLAVLGGWHMFVVHEALQAGELRAVSKIPKRREILVMEYVRAAVRKMKGADILTYELQDR